MATQLKLRIHSVKCVDETGGKYAEKFGNDEIYLGGFTLDAEGNPVKIPNFSVYPDFDDGDIKNFNPPRVFATFNLNGSNSWPKNFGVGFLLFEKDGGGMDNALENAFQKFKKEVDAKRISARTTGQESFIPWGTIFSVVIPIVVKYLKDKLASAISDDAFPLESAIISIPNANYKWNGSMVSPLNKIEFRGNDGIYYLFYDWELSGITLSSVIHAPLATELSEVRDHRTS